MNVCSNEQVPTKHIAADGVGQDTSKGPFYCSWMHFRHPSLTDACSSFTSSGLMKDHSSDTCFARGQMIFTRGPFDFKIHKHFLQHSSYLYE